jgi:hypothetical protein
MKRQKSCGPRLGKLVHQLPGVVTFAYDLRFRRVIARWKGIVEEIYFGGSIMPSTIIENLDLKKPSFRPSKWPRKLKSAKNSKLPKLPENCFEPVEKGGWPPISTWIKEKFYYGDLMQNSNKEIHKKNLIHMLAPLKLINGVHLGICASLEECAPLSLCLVDEESLRPLPWCASPQALALSC